MARKTVVAFPQRGAVSSLEGENLTAPAAEGGWRKEVVEEETSSSSSSDSDSSSDSEEEHDDGAAEVAVQSKAEFPRQDSIFSEDIAVKASMLAKENLPKKPHKEYAAKKKPCKPETDVSPVKQVTSFKTSKSKARDPKVESTPEEADGQKLVLEAPMVERQELSDVTSKSTGTQGAALQLKASAEAQEDEKQTLVFQGEKKVKETQEAEAAAAPKPEETSESTEVVVVGTAAQEETIQEAGVQAGEGSTIEATAKPAPEEFDNSTYKNLQHHEYNIYTFVDSVVGLSKFRQPQPSSGRASPRH
ncbi:NDUV3 dehydrogenase, partial [Galbula dea]|nr:NDUV3 dehydrogenase [Galbula dea]